MVAPRQARFYPKRLMVRTIRLLVRIYQYTFSPLLDLLSGPASGCRFQPTCSEYFLHAVEGHGAVRGIWLGLKRIARCHPWGGCGHDPVPSAITVQFVSE
jgi:putative membrane protein insertion efficiency factor